MSFFEEEDDVGRARGPEGGRGGRPGRLDQGPAGRRRNGGAAGSETARMPPAFALSVGAGGPGRKPATRGQRPAKSRCDCAYERYHEREPAGQRRRRQTGRLPGRPPGGLHPQQRRTILKGLRILARVAIRSYMREHAGGSRLRRTAAEREADAFPSDPDRPKPGPGRSLLSHGASGWTGSLRQHPGPCRLRR